MVVVNMFQLSRRNMKKRENRCSSTAIGMKMFIETLCIQNTQYNNIISEEGIGIFTDQPVETTV